MWTISRIRKHIFGLKKNQIFTTRDMLGYGTRTAVDKVMSQLVRLGEIIRVARGVFIRNDIDHEIPTPFEIAVAKAKSFNKQIVLIGEDALVALGVTHRRPNVDLKDKRADQVYGTSGRTSTFHCGDMKIRFVGYAQRKIALGDSKQGLALRILWQIGKKKCTDEIFDIVTSALNRSELKQFRSLVRYTPHWISDKYWVRVSPPPPSAFEPEM